MAQNRRTPSALVRLLLINAALYQAETGREVARYRFSAETLRRLSGRKLIRRAFLDDVTSEFADLGWYMLELETDYAILNAEKVRSWIKLGPKRLFDSGIVKLGDLALEERYEELYPSTSDDLEEND